MKNDFEAIKKAARIWWGVNGWNCLIAETCGLPDIHIKAMADPEYGWLVRFDYDHASKLGDHVGPATGKTRAEAAARLICEARRYLERERNAEAVTA